MRCRALRRQPTMPTGIPPSTSFHATGSQSLFTGATPSLKPPTFTEAFTMFPPLTAERKAVCCHTTWHIAISRLRTIPRPQDGSTFTFSPGTGRKEGTRLCARVTAPSLPRLTRMRFLLTRAQSGRRAVPMISILITRLASPMPLQAM